MLIILWKTFLFSLDFLTLFLILSDLWVFVHNLLQGFLLHFLYLYSLFSSLFPLHSLSESTCPYLQIEINSVIDDDNCQIYILSLNFYSILFLCGHILPGHISKGTPSHHGQSQLIIFPNSTFYSVHGCIILALHITNPKPESHLHSSHMPCNQFLTNITNLNILSECRSSPATCTTLLALV